MIANKKPKPVTPGIPRAARTRAYAAAAFMSLLFGGVAYEAYALEVRDNPHYRELADRQHVRTYEIAAPRGAINDLRGRPLAVSTDADSIYADPREVVDIPGTAEKLAKILGLDQADLEDKLAGDKRFVWIARHVNSTQAGALRKAKLAGIGVTSEPMRHYPGGASGGPVIGVAGIDGKGLDGLELKLDTLLTGERAKLDAIRDVKGKVLLEDGLVDAAPGATVTLTIDRTIQTIADAAIADAVESNKAKSGVAIVLEVGTGRVLAIANYPTFDPNAADVVHTDARDRAVTDTYEIGSVMKPFAVATALEDGVTRPDEEWDTENGEWQMSSKDRPIRDTHAHPSLTTSEIIKHSSNIGAAKIGLRLGAQRLAAGFRAFGFGARTGIELPGEQPGTIRDPRTWRDSELARMTFGYGITVTPIQLAAAIASFGNGGMYVPPRIVESIVDGEGHVIRARSAEPRRAVSEKTAAQMIPMLASVFDRGKEGGTAKDIYVAGFACMGKTGTAHKYDPAMHAYSPDRYFSSFAGLAPLDHPRVAIIAIVDEPSGGDYYGGKVAGPVFARVASETLRYLGVPGGSIEIPPPPGVTPIVPKAKKDVPPLPVVEDLPPAVGPDFRGMSVAKALDAARAAGVRVEISGTGRAVSEEVLSVEPPIVRVVFAERAVSTRGLP
ncbi:MAG TPA: penicillin-binding protein 2 [Kofleriaceae bacterium]|nr:penicillin-binding protein 2 [Kofleriaceae bacterium]